MAMRPPVGIERDAGGGAHDRARRVREHGHEVKLMAPPFANLDVKSTTNERHEAQASAKAVTAGLDQLSLADPGSRAKVSGRQRDQGRCTGSH